MKKDFLKTDPKIFLPLIFLTFLSLAVIYSIKPELFLNQLTYFVLGFFSFFIFSSIDYRIYPSLILPFYILGILLLLLTAFIGEITRGSVRWLEIGFFRLQPSEMFKPFLILTLSYFFSQEEKWEKRYLKPFLFFIFPVIIIFQQPDLGNVIIYTLIFLGLLFFAGFSFKVAIFLGTIFLGSFPLFWRFLKDYQRERLINFLNPTKDPLGKGYNLLQSVITVGSGGFLGRGLGRGTQSHLQFLPEFHTDFIFASLSEELGFLGAVLTIFLYFLILWRILEVSERSQNNFGRFFCFGVFLMVFSQIFINIGMNIGFLPITGITLPLVSFGGSSIISVMISLGIINNISKSLGTQDYLEIR